MFESLAKVMGIVFAAQGMIMCGVYFIGGLLLPNLLAPVYANVGATGRLVIGLISVFTIGNILMAHAFEHYPPSLSAPVTIFAIVVLQIFFAVVIFKIHPSPWLILATMAVAASCVWVSMLLQTKPD